MLNLLIIFLILGGLTVFRYLDSFWDEGLLPYPKGFSILVGGFALLYSLSFIWMFGSLVGLVISGLAFFDVIYGGVLWVFVLPWTLRMRKQPQVTKVSRAAYEAWQWGLIPLAVLTVANFFVSRYKSALVLVNNRAALLVVTGILIVGTLLRMFVDKRLTKPPESK